MVRSIRPGRSRVRAVASLIDRDYFQAKSHTRRMLAYGAVDCDLTPTTTIGASLTYQTMRQAPNERATSLCLLTNGQRHPLTDQFLNFPRNFQHLPSWNSFADTTTEYAAEVQQQVGKWSLFVRAFNRKIPRSWADAFIMPSAPSSGCEGHAVTVSAAKLFCR